MVNLVVDVGDGTFGDEVLAAALRGIESAGFSVGVADRSDEQFLAWLDDEFGGAWSSEAYAGSSYVARKGDAIAGFATFDPRGLRFDWLRGLGAQGDVGIFGPFGVGKAFRKSGIGPHLLTAALCGVAARGYARALIPAVGEEKLIEYYQRNSGAVIAERFDKGRFRDAHVKTVVLASGGGSNFAAVMERAKDGRLPLDVTALVCNVADAAVLRRAADVGVNAHSVVWDRAGETRAAYDARLRTAVEEEAPDLLLLLGWMHVLDGGFVRAFPNAINIHPAFLPLDGALDSVTMPDGSSLRAFRGPHAVCDALRAGAKWTGATAHRLSVQADRGDVLMRKPLRIATGADEAAVLEELHPIEHRLVAGAVMRWLFER